MSTHNNNEYQLLQNKSLEHVRDVIRGEGYSDHTSGLVPGHLQCNLVMLPQQWVEDFKEFCLANPKPCPLAAVSQPGDPRLPALGENIDIRTDVPKYFIYRDGVLTDQVTDISSFWRDDLTIFAIGCSFTFEHALARAGIAMRHMDENSTVPMFRTSVETIAKGPFSGGMVVSMRPIKRSDIDRVMEICGGFPLSHGTPIHVGDPADIGIEDVDTPDWGQRIDIREDEVPVFWGCGVTPQAAIIRAKIPFCITHAPGSMLITDVDESYTGPFVSQASNASTRTENAL